MPTEHRYWPHLTKVYWSRLHSSTSCWIRPSERFLKNCKETYISLRKQLSTPTHSRTSTCLRRERLATLATMLTPFSTASLSTPSKGLIRNPLFFSTQILLLWIGQVMTFDQKITLLYISSSLKISRVCCQISPKTMSTIAIWGRDLRT